MLLSAHKTGIDTNLGDGLKLDTPRGARLVIYTVLAEEDPSRARYCTKFADASEQRLLALPVFNEDDLVLPD